MTKSAADAISWAPLKDPNIGSFRTNRVWPLTGNEDPFGPDTPAGTECRGGFRRLRASRQGQARCQRPEARGLQTTRCRVQVVSVNSERDRCIRVFDFVRRVLVLAHFLLNPLTKFQT